MLKINRLLSLAVILTLSAVPAQAYDPTARQIKVADTFTENLVEGCATVQACLELIDELTLTPAETDPVVKAITGIVKSNGTAISAAVAGTDYLAPAAIGVTVQAYNATLASIASLGAIDLGGASSVEIPNGTAPTVDAAGEIAVDTTDNQLVYYGGAKRVLTYKKQAGFTVESPVAADDGVPIYSNPDPITITGIRCWAVGGTSAEITLTDGTNALDTMTCDTDGASDDGSIANSTFTANEQIFYNTGTVTGSVTYVNLIFTYTTDAE